VMMIIFTIYILAIIRFSKHLPCSCGGIISELSWKEHLFLNVFLILLAAIGIRALKKVDDSSRTFTYQY
jgi:hypothetical protein